MYDLHEQYSKITNANKKGYVWKIFYTYIENDSTKYEKRVFIAKDGKNNDNN